MPYLLNRVRRRAAGGPPPGGTTVTLGYTPDWPNFGTDVDVQWISAEGKYSFLRVTIPAGHTNPTALSVHALMRDDGAGSHSASAAIYSEDGLTKIAQSSTCDTAISDDVAGAWATFTFNNALVAGTTYNIAIGVSGGGGDAYIRGSDSFNGSLVPPAGVDPYAYYTASITNRPCDPMDATVGFLPRANRPFAIYLTYEHDG